MDKPLIQYVVIYADGSCETVETMTFMRILRAKIVYGFTPGGDWHLLKSNDASLPRLIGVN